MKKRVAKKILLSAAGCYAPRLGRRWVQAAKRVSRRFHTEEISITPRGTDRGGNPILPRLGDQEILFNAIWLVCEVINKTTFKAIKLKQGKIIERKEIK